MAKVKVIGNAVVVTSAVKLEDLRKLRKYAPEALTLKDEETGEPTFGVCTGPTGILNDVGAEFNGVSHDGQGLATITMSIDLGEKEDAKEVVAEVLGRPLMKLNALEAKLPAVLSDLNLKAAEIAASITVE